MGRLNAPALNRMNQVLAQHVADGLLPGAVVLVGAGGEVAHQATLGRLDPAGTQAMPADAIFRIYSMTKPIVSLATLMLADAGRLSLTDPITPSLPQFTDTPVGIVEEDGSLALQRALRPPTVHDLLRHTAGFTYEFLGDSPVQRQY